MCRKHDFLRRSLLPAAWILWENTSIAPHITFSEEHVNSLRGATRETIYQLPGSWHLPPEHALHPCPSSARSVDTNPARQQKVQIWRANLDSELIGVNGGVFFFTPILETSNRRVPESWTSMWILQPSKCRDNTKNYSSAANSPSRECYFM